MNDPSDSRLLFDPEDMQQFAGRAAAEFVYLKKIFESVGRDGKSELLETRIRAVEEKLRLFRDSKRSREELAAARDIEEAVVGLRDLVAVFVQYREGTAR